MALQLSVCVVLLCSLSSFVECKITYEGYKYVIATPTTQSHLQIIEHYRHVDRATVNVIDDPSGLNRPVSMVVSPKHIRQLTRQFKTHRLSYDIVHEDVGSVYEAQKTRHTKQNQQLNFDFTVYHPLSEIHDFIFEFVGNNSDIAELLQIGFSYEGRPFYAVHLSTDFGADRLALWMDGTIHANEWIAPATMLYFLNEIVALYRAGTDEIVSTVLDNMDVYIMVVYNVDGYEYTWTDDRLWRKTRSPNVGFPNCPGSDPNRNWDTQFWGELGVSPDPCANQYQGPGPFTEPEVRAVADYVSRNNIVAYLAYHSCSQYYMIPYGFSEELPPDYDELISVAQEAVDAATAVNNVTYEAGTLQSFFGLNSGSSADYTYDNLGIVYSFGIELRDGPGSPCTLELPEDQIIPTAEENFEALRVILNRVYEATVPAQ